MPSWASTGLASKCQMACQERQESVRPAHGAVDSGHRTGAEQLHDFLVVNIQGKVLQSGSTGVPFQDSDGRFLGGRGKIDAERPHEAAGTEAPRECRPPPQGPHRGQTWPTAGAPHGPRRRSHPRWRPSKALQRPRSAGFRTTTAGQRCGRRGRNSRERPTRARSCRPCRRHGHDGGQTSGQPCRTRPRSPPS